MKNPAINGISNKKFWNVAFEFWHIEFEVVGISLESRVLMNFSIRVFRSILKDFWSKYQVWNTGFFIWNTIHFEIMSQSNTIQLVFKIKFFIFPIYSERDWNFVLISLQSNAEYHCSELIDMVNHLSNLFLRYSLRYDL